MPRNSISAVLLLIVLSIASSTWAFTASQNNQHRHVVTPSPLAASSSAADGADPSDIVARKIVVCGDVDGGYYRSCVKNEVSVVC